MFQSTSKRLSLSHGLHATWWQHPPLPDVLHGVEAAVSSATGGSAAPVTAFAPGEEMDTERSHKSRTNLSESEDEAVPTRGLLKRQTRLIVDARTKKQNPRSRRQTE